MKTIYKGHNFVIQWSIMDAVTSLPFDFNDMFVEFIVYSDNYKGRISGCKISGNKMQAEIMANTLPVGVYDIVCSYKNSMNSGHCICRRAFNITRNPEFCSNTDRVVIESYASPLKLENMDINYLGHFPSEEVLPDSDKPAWALVGTLKFAHPWFFYTDNVVPPGFQTGWNDLSEVLGTYDLTADKVSIFDFNLVTEYNVSRNHPNIKRDFSNDWGMAKNYYPEYDEYQPYKVYQKGDYVNMPEYTEHTFIALCETSDAPFVVTSSSNEFTLEEALDVVPEDFKFPGIKITFANSETKKAETYYWLGGNWYSTERWVVPKGDNGLPPRLAVIGNKLHYSYDNENWVVCSDFIAHYFRIKDNKLQISPDNVNWEDVSDYIAAYFRFNSTFKESNGLTIGNIQISRDNKNWQDLSPEFVNHLRISAYVSTKGELPTNKPVGTMYGVGPTYKEEDTARANPIYRIYVYDGTTWVDNGSFTSISAGIVQEPGDNENAVMSQKAVTKELNEVNGTTLSKSFTVTQGEEFWQQINTNLKAGDKIKVLVSFADSTPSISKVVVSIGGKDYGVNANEETVLEIEQDSSYIRLYQSAGGVVSNGVLTFEWLIYKQKQWLEDIKEKVFELEDSLSETISQQNENIDSIKRISGTTITVENRDSSSSSVKISPLDNTTFYKGNRISITSAESENEEVDSYMVEFIRDYDSQHILIYKNSGYKGDIILNLTPRSVVVQSYKGGATYPIPATFKVEMKALGEAESVSNKVDELLETSTSNQYPSAKCVYTEFSSIKSKLGADIIVNNDDATTDTAVVKCSPEIMYKGRRVEISASGIEDENLTYLEILLIGNKSGQSQYTGMTPGMFSGIAINLDYNITKLVVYSYTEVGAKRYPAKFTVHFKAIGLLEKTEKALAYTPNENVTTSKSIYDEKVIALDSIGKPIEYDYALKNDSYKKIEVKTQNDFDNLNNLIKAASSYSNILVHIQDGHYFINNECMLDLSAIGNINAKICVNGNNVKISEKCVEYNAKNTVFCTGTHNAFVMSEKPTISRRTIFTDGEKMLNLTDSGVLTASGADYFETKITSVESGVWKAKLPYSFRNYYGKDADYFQNMKLWYACQWSGRLCEIARVDSEGYIYFKDTNTSPSPSIDQDPSRFVLINDPISQKGIYFDNQYIYIPVENELVYQHSSSTCILKGENETLGITFSGLKFVGINKVIKSNISHCNFTKCEFNGFSGFCDIPNGLLTTLTDDCLIRGCKFYNFYNFSLFSYGNIIIEDNTFENINIFQVGNPLGVWLIGGGIQYFGRNKCINVANQAVAVGLYAAGRSYYPDYSTFRGIVEYNEFYFTDDWKHDRYSCYDAGIIYLYTNPCGAIVRGNYLHDIKGYVTHGIYCDDGAYGFSIYKNIVCNVMDGYSINSRRLTKAQMENAINTDGYAVNVDNLMMYNVVNAPYRFVGSNDYEKYPNETERQNNGCCCAANFRMEMLRGNFGAKTDISDIYEFEDDTNSKSSKYVGNVLKLDGNLRNWKMPSVFNSLIKVYTK